VIYKDLFNEVLIKPALNGASDLFVITGYASPHIVHRQLSALSKKGVKVNVSILVGMISHDGMDLNSHLGFVALTQSHPGVSCAYLPSKYLTHSKNYLWYKNSKPHLAFSGSANFSVNAFFGGVIESVATDQPVEVDKLYKSLAPNAIDCNDQQIESYFRFTRNQLQVPTDYRSADQVLPSFKTLPFNASKLQNLTLSLLKTRSGLPSVHDAGGINWGHRGTRDRNEAYISVPTAQQGHFFPKVGTKFEVVCDDGRVLKMVAQGAGGKQITTPEHNNILGQYLRQRMGIASGKKVTLADFANYGRSDVTFYRKSFNKFFMDFSV
jgi:hypothetical protein